MKRTKKIILYSIITVVLVSGFALSKSKAFSLGVKKDDSKSVAVINKTSVQIQQPKVTEKSTGMTYKATLQASEVGVVSSKISGKVVQILFENGKSISKGDPLIILDDQDIKNQLRSAESQLNVAENQLSVAEITLQKLETGLENTQRNYDRMKALYDQGAVPEASFQDAESALKNAKADYKSGQINIETSKANIESSNINIDNLKVSLDNTIIKAPISGIMSDKSVNIGQLASPGGALGKVNDIATLDAVIQVEQENINKIAVGQKTVVNLSDGRETSVDGTVKSIDISADPSSRVFNCKIELDNKDNTLRPGVFAKAELLTVEKSQLLTIPIEALAGTEGKYYVLVDNNGTANKRVVTIGDTSENMVEIKSGIKKDDKIICTNVNMLQDGDKVEIASK